MIDRVFSAVLTFSLLVGGTLAIGSALFGAERPRLPSKPLAAKDPAVHRDRPVANRSGVSNDPLPIEAPRRWATRIGRIE